MNINNSLRKFIEELPADSKVKQELLKKLDAGQEQEVKEQVVTMLREAGRYLSAVQALDQAEAEYNQTLQDIDRQAGTLMKSLSNILDQQGLQQARASVN